jgi:valyl-tRNA synthetase
MLHPFMPFLTEELWDKAARISTVRRQLLVLSPWPTPTFEDAAAADEINWLIDLIAAIRSVRSELNVPAAAMVALSISGASANTIGRLRQHDAVIRRVARVEAIALAAAPTNGAIQIVLGEATVSMPLAGVIDIVAERGRLAKEVEKAAREIAKIEAKLGNEKFMAKAKEEVIEEQRERLAEATQLHAKTEAALTRLSG